MLSDGNLSILLVDNIKCCDDSAIYTMCINDTRYDKEFVLHNRSIFY